MIDSINYWINKVESLSVPWELHDESFLFINNSEEPCVNKYFIFLITDYLSVSSTTRATSQIDHNFLYYKMDLKTPAGSLSLCKTFISCGASNLFFHSFNSFHTVIFYICCKCSTIYRENFSPWLSAFSFSCIKIKEWMCNQQIYRKHLLLE